MEEDPDVAPPDPANSGSPGADRPVSYRATVAMDYGQFYLSGQRERVADRDLVLLTQAQSGDGVASDGHTMVVLSPHQNNFAMSLEIQHYWGLSEEDLSGWPEVCESHLHIDPDAGLTFDSPTLPSNSWPIPAGRFHLQVCGRGFVARGWPGSTEPGDTWLIRLWRCDCQVSTRRLRSWRG
jgi:hypothetical protein